MGSLRGRVAECLGIGSLLLAGAGCDLARGFQAAGDAIAPDQKSYLELGGTRLIAGSFYDVRLGIAPQQGAYLTARPGHRGDGGRALAVIDAQRQSECELADVAGYDADFARRGWPSLLLGYLEASDDSGSGTLRFVDPGCHSVGPSIAGASWPPLDKTADGGFAVRAAGGLSFVDVVSGNVRPLFGSFSAATILTSQRDDGSYVFEWAAQGDGQLVLFDAGWHELSRYGDGVDGFAVPNGFSSTQFTLYYTDTNGLHRLQLHPQTPDADAEELLEPDACQLHAAFRSQDVLADFEGVVYRSPCAATELVTRSGDMRYQFSVSADPALARVLLADQRLVLAFLRNVQPGTQRGDLSLATPTTYTGPGELIPPDQLYAPLPLGAELPVAHAVELDWTQQPDSMYTLADSDGTSGTLLSFALAELDTEPPLVGPDVVAEHVLTASEAADPDHVYPDLSYDALLINASGGVADQASDCPPHCTAADVSSSGLPVHGFLAMHDDYFQTDVPARWRALLLTDFDGTGGTLHVTDYWRDPVSTMTVLASGVAAGKFALLDLLPLPGAAFVTHWDAAAGRGRLEYDNVDLGFQQTIHEGVSELIPLLWPKPSLLFVVPDGADAGIWLSLAK